MTSTLCALCRCTILIFLLGTATAFADDDRSREVLAEMNAARTSPARYADHLRELRRHFQGKMLRMPDTEVMLRTNEGTSAVDEAIAYLSRQKPQPPLAWSAGLTEAATDLLREQGASGAVGHTGSHSGGMRQRVERHGTWSGRIAENIGYGPPSARLMVMQLIIDDGVKNRGHRKNIFDPALKVAGVACGAHPQYGTMCVTDFATGFGK